MMRNIGNFYRQATSSYISENFGSSLPFKIRQILEINNRLSIRGFDISALILIVAFTILSVVKGETTSAPLFDWEQIQLTENNIFPSFSEANKETFSCKAFPGTSQWPSDQTWNALNETLNSALLRPALLASICFNNTVYNNYDASQCEAVSASWTSIQDRYVARLLNKQSLALISILPAGV
jgi:hypothetical protein